MPINKMVRLQNVIPVYDNATGDVIGLTAVILEQFKDDSEGEDVAIASRTREVDIWNRMSAPQKTSANNALRAMRNLAT